MNIAKPALCSHSRRLLPAVLQVNVRTFTLATFHAYGSNTFDEGNQHVVNRRPAFTPDEQRSEVQEEICLVYVYAH